MLRDILDGVGADYKETGQSDEVTVCCPFCIERGFSPDKGHHLGVNTENGLAHCFRCGWKCGGLVGTAREICRAFGAKLSLRGLRTREGAQEEQAEEKPVPIGLPQGYESFGADKTDPVECKARQYLRFRNVSVLQIARHSIGYAGAGPYAWRILFPVHGDRGMVYGVVGRSFVKGVEPRYLNTPGMKLLWGAHRVAQRAVVAEGVMDALSVERAILRFGNTVALANLGSSITAIQLEQLKQYESVVLIPDADYSGVKGVIELAKACDNCRIKTSVVIPKRLDGSDPGEWPEAQLADMISDAEPWKKTVEWKLRALSGKR